MSLSLSSVLVIASDAGPLISLGRLDLLALLQVLFTQVQVPQQLVAECLTRPEQVDTRRVMAALNADGLLACVAVPLPEPIELGLGEQATIGRAREIGAGLLAVAKRAGRIGSIAPMIKQLRVGGQRHAAVADTLTMAGETPL